MKIQSTQSPAFGKIYYSTDPTTLPQAQQDVVQDITTFLNKNNYVEKLEKLKYDVYIKPQKNGYSLDMSFLQNASRTKNGDFKYSKIVMAGRYIRNSIIKYNKDMQGCYTTDKLAERFYKFFRNESKNLYKRFQNYL